MMERERDPWSFRVKVAALVVAVVKLLLEFYKLLR